MTSVLWLLLKKRGFLLQHNTQINLSFNLFYLNHLCIKLNLSNSTIPYKKVLYINILINGKTPTLINMTSPTRLSLKLSKHFFIYGRCFITMGLKKPVNQVLVLLELNCISKLKVIFYIFRCLFLFFKVFKKLFTIYLGRSLHDMQQKDL